MSLFTLATTYGPEVIQALEAVWQAFQEYTKLKKAGADAASVQEATDAMDAAYAQFRAVLTDGLAAPAPSA